MANTGTSPHIQEKSKTTSDHVPEHPVIVLGRQFGSGGRRVGEVLSDLLGIEYYDKELLSHSASEMGFDPALFAVSDERRPSPLRSMLQGLYGVADNFHTTGLCAENLWAAQSRVILSLAAKSPCVIVGRTADYVARDFPGLTSVFLHAPLGYRTSQIVARGDACCEADAVTLARRYDRNRENYYNYYTGRHWGHATNYDLTLDVSVLSPENAAKLIADFVRLRGEARSVAR